MSGGFASAAHAPHGIQALAQGAQAGGVGDAVIDAAGIGEAWLQSSLFGTPGGGRVEGYSSEDDQDGGAFSGSGGHGAYLGSIYISPVKGTDLRIDHPPQPAGPDLPLRVRGIEPLVPLWFLGKALHQKVQQAAQRRRHMFA